jgi:hypothetical protein
MTASTFGEAEDGREWPRREREGEKRERRRGEEQEEGEEGRPPETGEREIEGF